MAEATDKNNEFDDSSLEGLLDSNDFEKDTSELDSFFEDLTSLDDGELDIPDDSKEDEQKMFSGTLENENTNTAMIKPKDGKTNKKKSGGGLFTRRFWLVLIILLFLFVLLYGAYYLFFADKEFELPESSKVPDILGGNKGTYPPQPVFPTSPSLPPAQIDVVEEAFQNDVVEDTEIAGSLTKRDDYPVAVDPNGKYVVQVASCTFLTCVNEHKIRLKEIDYTVQTTNTPVRGEYLQMVSKQLFSLDKASEVSKQINSLNNYAGNAVPIKEGEQNRIYLGDFFYIEDFKIVKDNVETALGQLGTNIELILRSKRRRVNTTKVFAGPFASRQLAEQARDDIKNFAGMEKVFVTTIR